MENKMKYIIIAIVVIIAVVGVIGYFVLSDTINTPEMKNETIEGVTVSVPLETNLTKTAFDTYKDEKVGVQFAVQNSSAEVVFFGSAMDGRDDMNRITLENISSDTIAWKSDEGWINILVVNKDGSKGICVGAKDNEELAIKIANTVKF